MSFSFFIARSTALTYWCFDNFLLGHAIVTDRVVVGKIFNLEIFIVNRSHHIRRYTLVVPNRKRTKGSDPSQGSKILPPLPSGERAVMESVPIDPYMEETELLRRHVDNETTEADIICLENNVRLRYLNECCPQLGPSLIQE